MASSIDREDTDMQKLFLGSEKRHDCGTTQDSLGMSQIPHFHADILDSLEKLKMFLRDRGTLP